MRKKIIDSGKAEKAQKLKNNFDITLTGPIPKTEKPKVNPPPLSLIRDSLGSNDTRLLLVWKQGTE